MSPKTNADAYALWMEAFARAERGLAAFFYPEAEEEAQANARPETPDEDWVTEALFDLYND